MIRVLLLGILFSLTVSVQAQTLRVTANVSEAACGGTRHTVSVKVSGGQAPYTFRWNDGSTEAFRNDLSGGTYVCTVSDAAGKSAEYRKALPQLPTPVTVAFRQIQENGKTTLKAEAGGGVAPYTYMWLGTNLKVGQHTSSSIPNISPGNYQVIVQDAQGSPVQQSISIK